jgi:hypothetical protein
MTAKPDNELTAAQLADRLGVNLETVWRLVRAGLPHRRVKQKGRKRALRFAWTEVEAWTDLHPVTGKSARPESPAASVPGEVESIPETTRERLEAGELQAWQEWKEAEESGKPSARKFRNWLQLCLTLATFEKADLKSGRAQGEIRLDLERQVTALLTDWRNAVKAFLVTMPDTLAAKVNPGAPDIARAALTDFRDRQLVPMIERQLFDGKQ